MGVKGEVEYEIRADDSQIEKDLEQANKKVEKATEKSAEKTVKIEKEKTQDIKKEVEKVEDASKKSADKVEEAWEDSADNIKDAFKKSSEETQKKTEDTGSVFENVSGLIKDSFSDAATGAVPLLDKIEVLTAGLTGAQAVAVGLGAALVGIGIAGVSVATDMDSAMNDFIATTGKSVEETERYQGVLENIYANNYGEDFEDIANAMAKVEQNLGDLDDASLQNLTESAFALSDTFEYDVAESTRAAKALMDNFGVSGEEAMNMIAAGAQNGLDYSGELLDSISEYSVQFGKLGFTADDMFKIFQEGAESGAWNLDKIGDAVKEFSIRAIDGSDTTKEGFELLGYSAVASAEDIAATEAEIADLEKQLQYAQMEQDGFNKKTSELTRMKNADKIAEYTAKLEEAKSALAQMTDETANSGKSMDDLVSKFAAGGDEAQEAFNEIVSELAKMEDPIEQNAAGVALFGTMWEDLGPEVVSALADITDEAYATGEELNNIKDVKYDDLGSMFEALKRNVELLVIPIGEALIPILSMLIESVLPVLIEILGPLADLFAALLEPIMSLISMAIQPLIDIIVFLTTATITPLIDILNALLIIFTGVLESLFSSASDKIGNIVSIFQNLLQFIGNVFTGNWKGAFENIKAIVQGCLSPIQGVVQSVRAIFQNLIDFVKNVFTGNWRGAWENVKSIFSNAVSGLASIFKAPINAIVDGWNKLASNLGSVSIPEWVPIAGGKSFSLPTLSRLKIGLDYVPNDMFPAFLDEGEWVLTKEEAEVLRSLGGIEGVKSLLGKESSSQIIVENSGASIDYAELGEAVYGAFKRHGMCIYVNERELGRIIENISEERRI